MTKARDPQPEQQPEGVVPVKVIGVHLAVSKTTHGRKRAMTDFAARLQTAINSLVTEGRTVSSTVLEGEGAVVIGRLDGGVPPHILAMMQQRAMQQQQMQAQAQHHQLQTGPAPEPQADEPPYVRHGQHQRIQVGPPGEGFEINELSHQMVQQFMTMACQMPPMPPQQRDHMVTQLFDKVAEGIGPNDLQAAAVDVDKILALRKQRQSQQPDVEQVADDALLVKMRDMLLAKVRVGLN